MRFQNAWFYLPAVLGLLLFAVQSTQATSYVRGYVRPSGDGGACNISNSGPLCVDLSSSGMLLDGLNGSPDVYQIIGVANVAAGVEVDFTFTGQVTTSSTPVNLFGRSSSFGTAFSSFAVLPCAYTSDGTPVSQLQGPGIYNTNNIQVTANCTQFGTDPGTSGFPDLSKLITEDSSCVPKDMVCLTFNQLAGTTLPSLWFFVEDLSSSNNDAVISLTEKLNSSGSGTTPAPEPASMTLLAAGLVGLGALRRKRAA